MWDAFSTLLYKPLQVGVTKKSRNGECESTMPASGNPLFWIFVRRSKFYGNFCPSQIWLYRIGHPDSNNKRSFWYWVNSDGWRQLRSLVSSIWHCWWSAGDLLPQIPDNDERWIPSSEWILWHNRRGSLQFTPESTAVMGCPTPTNLLLPGRPSTPVCARIMIRTR
jgi:hypothetical protein